MTDCDLFVDVVAVERVDELVEVEAEVLVLVVEPCLVVVAVVLLDEVGLLVEPEREDEPLVVEEAVEVEDVELDVRVDVLPVAAVVVEVVCCFVSFSLAC